MSADDNISALSRDSLYREPRYIESRGDAFMYEGPKLVEDIAVEHPSNAGAEPGVDWANGLMRDVQEHVLQCALRYTRDRDAAEDVAEAVLAQLWIDHGEEMLRYDEEPLKEFLGLVVHRRFIDLRRR